MPQEDETRRAPRDRREPACAAQPRPQRARCCPPASDARPRFRVRLPARSRPFVRPSVQRHTAAGRAAAAAAAARPRDGPPLRHTPPPTRALADAPAPARGGPRGRPAGPGGHALALVAAGVVRVLGRRRRGARVEGDDALAAACDRHARRWRWRWRWRGRDERGAEDDVDDGARGARGESVELAESVGRAAGVVAARPDACACARGAATAAAAAAAAGWGGEEEPAGVGCVIGCGEGRGAWAGDGR
jgi:hypothetical protein